MKNLKIKDGTKLIDATNWRPFKIEEVAEVTSPKITQPNQVLKTGITPRISASILNNGIENFYSNQADNKGKVIIVNTAAKPFFLYEDYDFFTSGDIAKIEFPFELNEFLGLFLTCVMDRAITYPNQEKAFDYGYALSKGRINHIKIQLPINSENEVDWELMEN